MAAYQEVTLTALPPLLLPPLATPGTPCPLQSGAQIQLSALRTALRLGRRVVPGFGEPQASAGVLQQLPLLQRLVATLDALPASIDLAGLKVTIGGQASGVDALGTVWLAADGSQEAWARWVGACLREGRQGAAQPLLHH